MRVINVITPFTLAAARAMDDDLVRYVVAPFPHAPIDEPFARHVDRHGNFRQTGGYIDSDLLGVFHPGCERSPVTSTISKA